MAARTSGRTKHQQDGDVAQDALSLWRILTRGARLAPKSHDEKFVADLRQALDVPGAESIERFLRREAPSTTTFMLAFLNALEPFGRMLSDIYAMFERHQLTSSNERVLVDFDFSFGGALQFNVEHFRRAQEVYSSLRTSVASHQFAVNDMSYIAQGIAAELAAANGQSSGGWQPALGMRGGVPIHPNSEPTSEELRHWRKKGEERDKSHRWPFAAPPPFPPFSVEDPLMTATQPLRDAIQALSARYARFSSWSALNAAVNDTPMQEQEPGYHTRSDILSWSLPALRQHESDYLPYYALAQLWHLFELPPADRQARTRLAERIAAVIADNSNKAEVTTPQRALRDWLDLPLWKERAQVYSIWLITVVEHAFVTPDTFELAGVDGRLLFTMRPTCIAQLRRTGASLKLIAELRTSARGKLLLGKSRQRHVQPDYVIQRSDEAGHGKVIYVLEAKQYEKSSLQNFAAAIRDYAVVHRDAHIALANYGPVSARIEAKVTEMTQRMKDKGVNKRWAAFAHVEPTNPAAIESLRKDLRSALEAIQIPAYLQRPNLIVDVSGSMSSVLPGNAHDSGTPLWNAIVDTRMPIAFVRQDLATPGNPKDGAELLRTMQAHANSRLGVLSLQHLPPATRDGAILMTDQSGCDEMQQHHHELAAIIVLAKNGGARADRLLVHPAHRQRLESTVPQLMTILETSTLAG